MWKPKHVLKLLMRSAIMANNEGKVQEMPAATARRTRGAGATKAKSTVRSFTFDRETPNKVRMNEDSDTPIVGVLYLTKVAYGHLGSPTNIKMTLEVV
jgi:hypothetical protein